MFLIKNKIAEVRKEQKMNQQTLADKVGITRTYLSKVEHHKHYPSVELMSEICDALGKKFVDVFYVVEGYNFLARILSK